ncbi:MAG: SDR family oxidoreductase [Bacteroidota bacterium]|nr:SDR family oxidoreductase [Bacteroidota bacterium]
MKKTALITGASSGIGKELARLFAIDGHHLVLVARRIDVLNELKTEFEKAYGIKVLTLGADLTQGDSPAEIFSETEKQGIKIDFLVNNAGFGGHGKFHERSLADDMAMIDLNVKTLSALTHLYLQGMLERKSGKILNVASTAGFLPGPLQATYYATKAFVVSFSQAVAEEIAGSGVTVTALCPGPVATEFFDTANMNGSRLLKMQKAASPLHTARAGYRGMQKGRLVSFDDGLMKFSLNWIVPFMPRKLVLIVSRKTMEK